MGIQSMARWWVVVHISVVVVSLDQLARELKQAK
jgi:hypothetical protein